MLSSDRDFEATVRCFRLTSSDFEATGQCFRVASSDFEATVHCFCKSMDRAIGPNWIMW